ncbi:MAG: hypothetical protein A3F54_01580 [Candidatus Kerfeldbacteria bacterium RIFCSPHIGHO2_12_FULL_48_17]|uniref:DNA helicase UvrD n=1 Tax=Candidatus Kerfeldbacteria bacterium RIFCSPHIGHO2_12_FULL_48_17 TaxID=1798542 RepID=A0A1G2B8U9_9BACT|nr:MAG: hypothetical protein A3F54_01580 [Candidatus Kerfeldbacteria bacterium RIFCSPHIGHO2_12_FULL_48_17]
MKPYIIDLHTHSRFSRGCSKALTLAHIAHWCRKKGIDIVPTSDFTHPIWFAELQTQLEEAEPCLYRLRAETWLDYVTQHPELKNSPIPATRFINTTELSCIYKKHDKALGEDKARRVHVLITAPSLAIVTKINAKLTKGGYNITSDGRPILGLDAKELLKIILDIDPRCLLIPAHIWTPWFAIFGSKSGFNSLEEVFDELTPHIHAIETGLSSDPKMNWALKQLNNITILSNSDAHSVENLAREANVFAMEAPSYKEIARIITTNDRTRFLHTIEFYPEEGKYHNDGHAACKINLTPEQSAKHRGLCPKCGQKLTIGVLNRVRELADQQPHAQNRVPAKYVVPLQQIIAEVTGTGPKSKTVQQEYERLVKHAPEFTLLLQTPITEIAAVTSYPEIATGIERMRSGQMHIIPGYDGQYGVVKIFEEATKKKEKQGMLF